jgi:hypothetical protein
VLPDIDTSWRSLWRRVTTKGNTHTHTHTHTHMGKTEEIAEQTIIRQNGARTFSDDCGENIKFYYEWEECWETCNQSGVTSLSQTCRWRRAFRQPIYTAHERTYEGNTTATKLKEYFKACTGRCGRKVGTPAYHWGDRGYKSRPEDKPSPHVLRGCPQSLPPNAGILP